MIFWDKNFYCSYDRCRAVDSVKLNRLSWGTGTHMDRRNYRTSKGQRERELGNRTNVGKDKVQHIRKIRIIWLMSRHPRHEAWTHFKSFLMHINVYCSRSLAINEPFISSNIKNNCTGLGGLAAPPSVSPRWFRSRSWQIGGIMNSGMLGECRCKHMPSFALQTSVCQLQQWQSIFLPPLLLLFLEW